ncbi:MAG: hypothetical protein ACYCW6_32505, partial [Candidatus Xenobia bacterium]
MKPRDWCVLAYLNGNNNLEPDLVRNVLDMQKVGSSDSVDVVTQLARAPQKVAHPGKPHDHLDGDWAGVQRYHVEPSPSLKKITSPVVSQLSDNTDMGKTRTLEDFLTWGVQHYPARHYVFLLSNHGLGY